MDFRDFDEAVRRAARDASAAADRIAPVAERVAPAYKAATLAVLPFVSAGAATPFLPFAAALPAQVFLPSQVSIPLFLFSQDFREGIRESAAKDTGSQAVSILFSHFLAPR